MIKKDNTIINERLLYLINNYPKDRKSKEPKSKLEFAKLLYDNLWELLGFTEKRFFNDRYNYTSPENKNYRNDVDIVYKELCNDLKLENCNTSKANYIIAYCKYFGCSADYLLGFIDSPTHEKANFKKLTGLYDNCLDTLMECNKHEPLDNSWAEYNRNITNILNYLLYHGKEKEDRSANHDKLTLLNDIFNFIMFSDFDSYLDNNGRLQGSHITFVNKSGQSICTLPVDDMNNVIKLNINSTLDRLKDDMKKSQFYILRKTDITDYLQDIKENQDKIKGYDDELEIVYSINPIDRNRLEILVRCKGLCEEEIHQAELRIVSRDYIDLLYKHDFSQFEKWQQSILENIYAKNEWNIKEFWEYLNT